MNTRIQFFLISLLCLALGFFPPAAQAFQSVNSSEGNLRWDQATLLSGFLKPLSAQSPDTLTVAVKEDKQLQLPVWRAGQSAKGLWIITPGTGSNPRDNMASFLAERAAATGFDAIVLANPFSTTFQTQVSSDGIVGIPQRDTDDLVKLVNAAYTAYADRYGQPSQVHLLGLSLGAAYTLLLEVHQEELVFSVGKFVAVNPPVNFQAGMDQIDAMINQGLQFNSLHEWQRQMSYLLPIFLQIFYRDGGGVESKSFAQLRDLLSGDENLHREIIGISFQDTMRHVSMGLTQLATFSESMRERIRKMQDTITFAWYEGFIGVRVENDPRIAGQTLAQLAHENDLAEVLPRSPRLADTYVIETKDDFLLLPADLEMLDAQLGERLFVFSSGGHCGEIWMKEFQNILTRLAN